MSTWVAGRGLRLLSIDGGGIRGLSAILILREVLYRMQQQQGLAEIPRPCDIFDLAGGTGMGGIIVLMLFRLKMTIDDAIKAYADLSRYVFSEKRRWPVEDSIFKSNVLESAITFTIQTATNLGANQAWKLRMLNQGGPKCFVCALPTRDMIFPTLFRSFLPALNPVYNCTVLEAARATSAAISIFEEAEINYLGLKETFVGGSMGTNNPTLHVVHEAKSAFPNQEISCLLSLGTGTKGVIGMSRSGDITTMRLIDVLGRIAIDCEATSENAARYLSQAEVAYFRLDIQQAARLTEWEELPVVQTHTDQYLTQYEVVRKVDQLVRTLIESAAPVMLEATYTPPTMKLSAARQQAFLELKASVSINAFHDSSAPLGCLPGTRKDQIGTITNWIESQNSNRKPLFVVLGPAGSGKSCLMWTVAQICKDKGSYAAGFYFSRADPERNNSDRLINTIVYQICEVIPELRPYVARVVQTEASTLSRSLYSRLYSLLLRPFCQLQTDKPGISFRPRIIIIDAVDACGNENDQSQLIAILTEALSSGLFPFLCILSSRFGRHIENVLSSDPLICVGVTLGLAGAKEMQDIRSYLDHRVKDIRKGHPSRAQIPEGWPVDSDIQTIARRSGGQFIYAETVIRYIESPGHRPQDRLQDIVASKTGTGAFDVLDDLYQRLMFSIKNIKSAIEILGIEVVRLSSQFWTPEGLAYRHFVKDHFVKLDAGTVLAPLAPVLRYEDHRIKLYHPSFSEFLLDPARSREYFVQPTKWQKWSVSRLVQLFYDKGTHAGDVDYLIKEAKLGTELHQFINAGLELVVNHPKRLPIGGNFNIWPLVTEVFFWRLRFGIWVEKIATVFLQQGKAFLPLPVLIKLASIHKLSNSFLMFELCRTIAALKVTRFIQESDKDWQPDPDGLFRCMTYLADYFDDQHCSGRSVLMPEDYLSATLRCLWYLHTPRRGIHSSLREQLRSLKYLPARLGIPQYLRDAANNITHGILEVLFSLLPQSPPSVDLLVALNKPFDSEVVLMNPSLSRNARNFIHEYLKHHDVDYQGGLLEEADDAEDVLLPHFKWFLIQDNEQ